MNNSKLSLTILPIMSLLVSFWAHSATATTPSVVQLQQNQVTLQLVNTENTDSRSGVPKNVGNGGTR